MTLDRSPLWGRKRGHVVTLDRSPLLRPTAAPRCAKRPSSRVASLPTAPTRGRKKARSGLMFSPPTLSPRTVRRTRSSLSCPALNSSPPASANCRARPSSRPSRRPKKEAEKGVKGGRKRGHVVNLDRSPLLRPTAAPRCAKRPSSRVASLPSASTRGRKKARSGLMFSPPTLSPRTMRRRRSSTACPALLSSPPVSANCPARQSSRTCQTSSENGGFPAPRPPENRSEASNEHRNTR